MEHSSGTQYSHDGHSVLSAALGTKWGQYWPCKPHPYTIHPQRRIDGNRNPGRDLRCNRTTNARQSQCGKSPFESYRGSFFGLRNCRRPLGLRRTPRARALGVSRFPPAPQRLAAHQSTRRVHYPPAASALITATGPLSCQNSRALSLTRAIGLTTCRVPVPR